MKKFLLIIFALLIAGAGVYGQASPSGKKEKKLVEKFLTYMQGEKAPAYDKMMKSISKEYIKENNLKVEDYKVDNYTIHGHSIEAYNAATGIVTAKVWGEDRSWVHRLFFKVVKEGGKLYIFPSGHSDAYIFPWWDRETYIKEPKEN
jgi:ABC-type glycerol-3-phosphate transport system substrate-binding protein